MRCSANSLLPGRRFSGDPAKPLAGIRQHQVAFAELSKSQPIAAPRPKWKISSASKLQAAGQTPAKSAWPFIGAPPPSVSIQGPEKKRWTRCDI